VRAYENKRSKGVSRLFATFMDDYSKLSVAITIEKKSQVVAVERNTVARRLELQSGKKLNAMRSEWIESGKQVRAWRDGGLL
jgi:ribonuclease P protein component